MIDLHVHSTRSDGTYTPTELVDYAIAKGLTAFALTDHDTVAGLDEAIGYAEKLKKQAAADLPADASGGVSADASSRPPTPQIPDVIPGIEFSTEYHGKDVHILGLCIDYHNKSFTKKLQEFVDSRVTRNEKMCRLLQEHGISISYETLLAEFPDAVITRAHYARYLISRGYVKSISEAFDRYVGDYAACYVPREKVTPIQAVELILEAGGIPILAHPILYHMSDSHLDHLTAELTEAGLMGIEAIYSTYKPTEERQIRALAAKYGLCLSGGSDFHGSNKPGLDLGIGYGKLYIPDDILLKLKGALHTI